MMEQLWTRSLAIAAGVLLVGAGSAQAISIDYVPVGDSGNAVDPVVSGFDPAIQGSVGAVAYDYDIGRSEVTVGEYVEFLNAKAGDADVKGLYSAGMPIAKSGAVYSTTSANLPINYVSWGDAARFANWVGNGGGGGDMETGAYALGGATDAASLALVSRVGGSVFIASDDEWYKAAFYGGAATWWDFAVDGGTNATPASGAAPGGSTHANYSNGIGNMIDVESYTTSTSHYGAFDMMGNVFEWTDTLVNNTGTDWFIKRGGAWADSAFGIKSQVRTGETLRTTEKDTVGFRLSSIGGSTDGGSPVPEPSTWAMALVGLLGMGFVAYRRRAA